MQMKTFLLMASAVLGLVVAAQAVPTMPKGHPPIERFTKVSKLMEDKCLACHTRDFELPFYAAIPGIKQIIEKDYTDGLRAMDLNVELLTRPANAPISESVLAKMEWVVLNRTMPPAKFTAVHWGSRMSAEDEKLVLDWVKSSRVAHYATGRAAPDKANEPIQPMVESLPVDTKKVVLGEKLFFDKRLSGDDTVSCSTCHGLDKGGIDGLRFSEGVRKQVGDINAPTVFNAAFNIQQFWNGRAADLQEQAAGPPFNPIEMDSKDWDQVIGKLSKDTAFTSEFVAIYPAGWTGDNITDAIAEFEKTLITPNSRFDKWLMGDAKAISADEEKGYQLFKAYRCSSCHVGQALGGQSFEYMDLKQDYFADRGGTLGSDIGLQGFTNKPEDLRRFKVSNLRNIELTAPYLHDGTVTSLDEATRIMGVYLSGMAVPENDRKLIVAFMRSLTGEYKGQPLAGPKVAN